MNELVERNNIYFMYLKDSPKYIYLVLSRGLNFYEYQSKVFIGTEDDLYDNENLVIAPIDILLYHLDSLEYLHKNYNEEEKFKRKAKLMLPNIYKKQRYLFSYKELEELYHIINNDQENVWEYVALYDYYFKNRKKDSVLRIYSN